MELTARAANEMSPS